MARYSTSITVENNFWIGKVFNEKGEEIFKTTPHLDQLQIAKEITNFFSSTQTSYTPETEPQVPRIPVAFQPVACCGQSSG